MSKLINADQDMIAKVLGPAEVAGTGPTRRESDQPMSERYPLYYKKVGELTEVDVYAVCNIFEVSDFSGCVHHAIKKLLLPGTRTGGKSRYNDIKEARDTLTRWLELNKSQPLSGTEILKMQAQQDIQDHATIVKSKS